MSVLATYHPPVNGYARPKSCAAVAAVAILEEILTRYPGSDADGLIRALAKILRVGAPSIRVARCLSVEQRNQVRRGERPLVVPRGFERVAA
jgi:hypothetical protein